MAVNNVGKGLKTRWQGLSPRQQALVLMVGVPIIVALAFLGYWGWSPNMVPLFSDLDSRDAAAVVEQLKANKVSYSLINQGTTILVPEKDVYDLRLQMVTSGAVSSGGFELFDETKLGATDFERRVNYQRALQEELRRTIVQLDEVEQARVHLVLPKESVFADQEQAASASVALRLKPLKQLSKEQVRGIVLLVQNSVEGLKPENITVINMAGNVLKGEGAEEYGSTVGGEVFKEQELKEAFQTQTQRRIQTLLDAIFGPGKAVVVVSADLDFSQRETHSVTYGKQSIRSETGSVTGNGSPENSEAGGVAGVDSNVPDYQAEDSAQENTGSSPIINNSEEYQRNYELDTVEERIVFSPGEVKRISAAVVVDGQLSPEKSEEIYRLVTSAIGLDLTRGDVLTVSSMDFDTTFQSETNKALDELSKQEQAEQLRNERYFWIKTGLAVLGFVLALVFVLRALKSRNAGSLEVLEEPLPVKQIAEEMDVKTDPIIKQKQDRVKKYIEDKPEEAANILKTWLTYEE